MIDHKAGDMRTVTIEAVMPDGSEVMIKGYNRWISTAALCPLPDPHAGLRDAVAEAAREWWEALPEEVLMPSGPLGVAIQNMIKAVLALNAALAPPDPVGELLAAARLAANHMSGMSLHHGAEKLRAAIAAVEAERRV